MLNTLRAELRRRQDYVPEAVETGSVSSQVASGSLWTGMGLLVVTGIAFVRSMVFARLLPPGAFGVLNLASVFTDFILLFANFGITSSVVFWRKLSRVDLATCWWGSLMLDAAAAVICVAFALTSSRWLDQPQTKWIIAILASQYVIVSAGSINAALMRRQFMFRSLAEVEIASNVTGFAVGYVMIAFFDLGLWGLVVGGVVSTVTRAVLYLARVPWLPSFTFSWRNLREHANYGRWFLGVTVVTYANQNVDRALIGTKLHTTQLGYYEYASNLPTQATLQLGQLLNSVLFPAFASLQDDLAELRRVLLRVMKANAFIIYPFLIGLALTARDFVLVAYGEKWLPIVWPMRVFCLFGLVRMVTNPSYTLCNGVGKPALPFKWSLIALLPNWVILWLAVGTRNVTLVAAAKIFLPLFMLLTLVVEITRHVGMPVRQVIVATLPAVGCCLGMSAVVLGVHHLPAVGALPALPRLAAEVAAGAATYLALMRGFFPQDFAALARLAKRALPARARA